MQRAVSFGSELMQVESKSGDSATFLQDRARQFHFKYALRKHEAAVYDVAYSPCGAMLASAAFDKTVKIWHMEESMKQQAQSLAEHTSLVSGVSWSAQSTSILSGGFDHRLKFWDISTGVSLAAWCTFGANLNDCGYVGEYCYLHYRGLHTIRCDRPYRRQYAICGYSCSFNCCIRQEVSLDVGAVCIRVWYVCRQPEIVATLQNPEGTHVNSIYVFKTGRGILAGDRYGRLFVILI